MAEAHWLVRTISFFALVAGATGFAPSAAPGAARARARRSAHATAMKDWSKRETLADKAGGLSDKGAAAVGLIGTIPVEFHQGNSTLRTMALVNQPLSEVAAQAGQFIKYKCGKGECGTCEVRVDGQWIRTCSTRVPTLSPGQTYSVTVRGSMVQTKKASRFFSIRSFFAGFKNNVLGMVGFVREGRRSGGQFKERLDNEQRILQLAAQKKAAKKAAEEAAARSESVR